MKSMMLLSDFISKLDKILCTANIKPIYLLILAVSLNANSGILTINQNAYDNFSGNFIYNNNNIGALKPFIAGVPDLSTISSTNPTPEITDLTALALGEEINLLSNDNIVTTIGKQAKSNYNNEYLFEYISNITDNLTIIPHAELKDQLASSVVYLGATCYEDDQGKKLGMFSYKAGYNLDLQTGFIKQIIDINGAKTTNNISDIPANLLKLRSIVIAGAIGDKSADAFTITSSQPNSLELADDLVIAKTASILGGANKYGLKLNVDNENISLTADIYNYGNIFAATAVAIGYGNNKFPLVPHSGTVAKLINTGNIEGHIIIAGQQHTKVNCFKLTNQATAIISGNIILDNNSTLKFSLVNKAGGVINSDIITVNNLDNSGTINDKTHNSMLTITANKITNNINGTIWGNFAISTNGNSELINYGELKSDNISLTKLENYGTIENNTMPLVISAKEIINNTNAVISANLVVTANTNASLINNGKVNSDQIKLGEITNNNIISNNKTQLKITANKIQNNLSGVIFGNFMLAKTGSELINEGTVCSDSIQLTKLINNGNIINNSSVLAINSSEITNNLTGTIDANFVANGNSQITNYGNITAEKIKVTKVNNYNSICLSEMANYLTDALEVNDYIAEANSKLYISFADDLMELNPNITIVNIANKAEFKANAKIVLCSENNSAANSTVAITLIKADNSLQLASGSIEKTLYSQVFKKEYDYYIIAATNSIATNNKITTDLQVIKLYDRRLKEAKMKAGQILSAIHFKKEIEKHAGINAYFPYGKKENLQIKGIKISEALTEDIKTTELYNYAVNASNNPEEVIDLILPDSSNSQLIAHNSLDDRLSEHINARLASKNLAFINNLMPQAQGVNAGELGENIALWSSFSCFYTKETSSKDKNDTAHINASVYSAGADTLLNNDITIGLCYSYSRATADSKGAMASTQKANVKMFNHAVSVYSGIIINDIDTNFRITYAMATHKHEDTNKLIKDYNSSILGVQATANHEVELIEDFKVDVFSSIAFSIITATERENKYASTIPKKDNKLIKLSAGLAVKDTQQLTNGVKFNYRIACSYKNIATLGIKTSRLILSRSPISNEASIVTIKERIPSKHKFALDALFNLQPSNNIRFELDINLTAGKKIIEYGAGLVLRYIF